MRFIFLVFIFCWRAPALGDVDGIRLPSGFKIEVFQDNISDARSLALSPSGIVFVGSRSSEGVRAVFKRPFYTGTAKEGVVAIGKELRTPNGVAFRQGALYVAEVNRVLRYSNIEKQIQENKFQFDVLRDDLPTETHHGWKYISFGPDGWLYIPIGAPCNVCESKDPRFASISRMSADGKKFEVYAKGVRNTVGFDWHPQNKNQLWFTDNGRDWLGDDRPNDELNIAPKANMHFGFPYCHDTDIKDPDFGSSKNCAQYEKPQSVLGPHVAALGMKFYRGQQFPPQYRGKIFIAQHGSWNRSKKIGYRIGTVDPNKKNSFEVFADGWLTGDSVSGRPVDILEMPDGSLLVSDDHAQKIYRIFYGR